MSKKPNILEEFTSRADTIMSSTDFLNKYSNNGSKVVTIGDADNNAYIVVQNGQVMMAGFSVPGQDGEKSDKIALVSRESLIEKLGPEGMEGMDQRVAEVTAETAAEVTAASKGFYVGVTGPAPTGP